VPGTEIPQLVELEEVRTMLAERVKEWQMGLQKGRAALVRQLEKRFGPLPEEARQRIESLDFETIVDLSASAATAPSLAALGLSSTP
jgi:uncharacterized protein YfbU (UPF0304 family)